MIVILHSTSYKKHVMETEYFAMSTHKKTRKQAFCPKSTVEER